MKKVNFYQPPNADLLSCRFEHIQYVWQNISSSSAHRHRNPTRQRQKGEEIFLLQVNHSPLSFSMSWHPAGGQYTFNNYTLNYGN